MNQDHDHDGAGGRDGAESLAQRVDNVELTTVGIDVGSSTFHLMFSRVCLHRETQRLSSRFEVVAREPLWRSEIRPTPYCGRLIDADAVGEFVAAGHVAAGLSPGEVDTGAVIFTGEALRRQNAPALAERIAGGSGKFVCVSAGHHLEAMLAAHGSGAVAYASRTGRRLLHVDIGGGTTKLALIDGGQVEATAAYAVGGRQVAWDEQRRVLGTATGARTVARAAGVGIAVGCTFFPADEERFAATQAEEVLALVAGQEGPLGRRLRLTARLAGGAAGAGFAVDALTFSGGVSEYVYGRETTSYGDLGAALGRALRAAIEAGRPGRPVVDPGEGIRATVVGASQCSVQLSGNTVAVSDPAVLPVHNVPVVHPQMPEWGDGRPLNPDELATAVQGAVSRHGLDLEDAVALAFSWQGDPSYARMKAFAQGVQQAADVVSTAPVIVLMDEDVGASVGRLLLSELPLGRPLICLDGLELSPLDHVDVGTILEPSGALPVVIKSLLFPLAAETLRPLVCPRGCDVLLRWTPCAEPSR